MWVIGPHVLAKKHLMIGKELHFLLCEKRGHSNCSIVSWTGIFMHFVKSLLCSIIFQLFNIMLNNRYFLLQNIRKRCCQRQILVCFITYEEKYFIQKAKALSIFPLLLVYFCFSQIRISNFEIPLRSEKRSISSVQRKNIISWIINWVYFLFLSFIK